MTAEPNLDPRARATAALPEKAVDRLAPDSSIGMTYTDLDSIKAEAAKARKAVKDSAASTPAEALKDVLTRGDGATAEELLDARKANIGTEMVINAKGVAEKKYPDPGTPEETRAVLADKYDLVAREIIEKKGKVDLKKPEYADLKKSLNELFDSGPLSFMDPAKRDAFFEEILQDENFLREFAKGSSENAEVRLTGAEAVIEARIKRKGADEKFTAAEIKQQDAGKKVKDLEQWEIDSKTVPPSGRYATLDGLKNGRDLSTEKADAENRKRITQDTLTKAEAKLVQEETKLLSDPTNATFITDRDNAKNARDAAKNARDAEQKTLAAVEKDIAELRKMESEINALPQSLRDAKQELATADGELTTATTEKNSADAAYSSAYLQRSQAENTWVTQKRNLAKDAVQRMMNTNLEAVNEADVARLEKEKTDAVTEIDKHMADYIERRYFKDRDPSVRNSSGKEIKKDEAHRDVKTLLRQGGGVESLVKDALLAKGLTAVEIDEKMKDPEFVKKWGGQMAEQSMSIYLRTGGRLSAQEGMYIENQEWGHGLIEKGLATNESVKKIEEKLKEKGILKSGGFREFLSNHKKSVAAGAIIVFLLSIMSGGLLPAGIITGKEGAAGLIPAIQPLLQEAQANLQKL